MVASETKQKSSDSTKNRTLLPAVAYFFVNRIYENLIYWINCVQQLDDLLSIWIAFYATGRRLFTSCGNRL